MRKTSALPNSSPDSLDFPFGGIVDEIGAIPGTPVIEATYSDFIQSLWKFFSVSGTIPNGKKESRANGFQLFRAMEKVLDPVGTIKIWPSLSIMPTGYVSCAGQELYTADNADLFGLIGYTFGGAGAIFQLPNFSGKFPLALGQTFNMLGANGGEINHKLLTGELPIHSHSINGQDNDATPNGLSGEVSNVENPGTPGAVANRQTSNTGSGTAHNNMPPYIVMVYIIKTNYA